MGKSVNKVILLGNVGKDPETRSTASGKLMASFSLATSFNQKDQQGNWQEHTEWHNIVAYERLAEIVRDYVKKGSKLYIEGRITTRNWEDKEFAGRKVYRTEIILNDLSLLSGRDEGAGGSSRPSSAQSSQGSAAGFDQRPPASQDEYAQSAGITDEDIPF
ncbi:MAG: single-stranded DNA-binding protein [Terracidiphilus sp.]